ncbi:MAG: DUF4091 domain-containing protein, partial [Planctomycetaceae bacterium]|nr:DUF4091 domain-containing protein [Planctomycetaceae bacterium]
AETEWEHRLQEGWDYLCRSTFRIINPTDAALENVPVLMTLRGTQAHGLLGPLTDLTLADGSPVTWLDEENFRLTCNISVPAKTVKYFNVYYRFDEDFFLAQRHKEHEETFVSFVPLCETENQFDGQFDADTAHPELQRETDPLADLPNLVRNGDFENGTEGWNRNDANPPAGVRYSVERSPELVRFGTQALRLDVAPGTPVSWRGWTQRIEVKSSHSYLVQGWMRGIDLESARIHLHFHTADGGFTANGSMSSIDRDIAGTTDWTRVAEIITTPPDARLMSIHLTMNGTGTLLHDNITVVDGLFAEQIDRESYYTGDIRIWQVPAVMKVFPQTIPPKWVRESKQEDLVFRIEAARNEKEPMQIAMRGYRCRGIGGFSVYQWRYELSTRPFGLYYKRIDEIKLDADLDTMRTVGYVNIDYPSSYYNSTSPKWYRMLPTSAPGADGWAGLWPDPLLEWGNDPTQGFPEYFDGAGTEALWFTWSIPEYAQAGKYMGTFVVSEMSAGGYTVNQQYLNMEVRVRDFTLPDAPNLTAIYDVRFGPGGGRQWGNSERDIQREIVELMTANRLSPDVIMPSPGLTFQDGKPVFDWREFDEVAEWYFNELNVRQVYTPWLFYIFGWGHPPSDFFGERPYPGVRPFAEADFSQLRPEYKAKYQAALREFWNHITEKGWGDRFILYVSDEPNYWTPHIITQMQAVCAMIHEVDPSIPTFVSTWRYIPEWAESITVWGIGHYGIVPVETMKEIKEHGSRIWFTTDGMLCLDTPYNAIERLLPYYCFKFGADAYEFWGISWLTYDPYQYGSHAYIHQTSTPGEYYWVRYPNGDGYLLYPPRNSNGKIVSSIRFEQAREGMEDFEYFTMLSQLIEQGKQSGKDVTQGEAALAEALSLVESPTAIGRYSSRILPNPYRIYEVRRRVAEAIEGLGSPHNR